MTSRTLSVLSKMNCKANFILCKFSSLDPFVKRFLLKSYCLSLYSCSLWSLSTPSLRSIEVALNRILRRICNLPQRSHTSIVHCTAKVPTISHMVYCSLLLSVFSSPSMFLKSLTQFIWSFTGYNYVFGHNRLTKYCFNYMHTTGFIQSLRFVYGLSHLVKV